MYIFLFLFIINVLIGVFVFNKTEDTSTTLWAFGVGLFFCSSIVLLFKVIFLKWKSVWGIIGKIVLILFLSILIFILGFVGLILWDSMNEIKTNPPLKEYQTTLERLVYPEYYYRIAHFPKKIPVGAKRYYFYIDKSFDGYSIHYLSFYIDDEFLNRTIQENSDNIYRKIKYSEISNYYRLLGYLFDVNDKRTYDVYILKNQEDDTRYTSGFVVSTVEHHIIYFYGNYNLKVYNY